MERIFAAVREHSMFAQKQAVLACVSGGADSMAMLHFLQKNSDALGIKKLYVLHINHGLRPLESPLEQRGVELFCEQLRVQCFSEQLNMDSSVKPKGLTPEEWARKLRYAQFESYSEKLNAVVATAHTLTDNAETILFNLVRGTGLKGASGIPAVRGRIVRPLIYTARDAVLQYCRANSIEFFTDSSNLTDDYTRNFIRHNVTPALQRINAAAAENLCRFASQASLADSYLSKQAMLLLGEAKTSQDTYNVQKLLQAPQAVLLCALHILISPYSSSEAQVRLSREALNKTDTQLQLNADTLLRVRQGSAQIISDANGCKEYCAPCLPGENVLPLGRRIIVHILSKEDLEKSEKICKTLLKNTADYDKIDGNLYFRSRKQGEEFSSYTRGQTKSLKKLFNEMRIPSSERQVYPAAFDSSRTVWVAGQGVAKPVAPCIDTKRYIIFEEG